MSDTTSLYYENGRQGWVYVLSNPSMPGLYKVGATRKHPLQRAKELGAGTGIPTPFAVAYYRDFEDAFLAESLTHQHFTSHRTDESREFFRANLHDLVAFIDSLSASVRYKELASQGLVGGEYIAPPRPSDSQIPTPWAELFASFPDDGDPRELTPDEQIQCDQLRRHLGS